MICKECGNEYNSETELFCPMCGAKSPDFEKQGEDSTASKQSSNNRNYHEPDDSSKRKLKIILKIIGASILMILGILTYIFKFMDDVKEPSKEVGENLNPECLANVDPDDDITSDLSSLLERQEEARKELQEKDNSITADFPDVETVNPSEKDSEIGFEPNEYDKQYFIPDSEDYVIIQAIPHVIEMYSYDGDGEIIHYRVRMEKTSAISQEQEDKMESVLKKAGYSNIEVVDRFVYMDYTTDEPLLSQEEYEANSKELGIKLLESHRKSESEQADHQTDSSKESEVEGYIFTKMDKKYFVPASDNYVIIQNKDNHYLLYSFDKDNICMNCRMRVDCGFVIKKENEEEYKKIFEDGLKAENIVFVDSFGYMDIPFLSKYTKDMLISDLPVSGFTIITNHVGNHAAQKSTDPVTQENTYEFTKLDKKYFKPATKNYIVVRTKPNQHLRLFSFDENGVCIQARIKIDFMDTTDVMQEKFTKTLKDEMGAYNIKYVDSYVYMDGPIAYRMSRGLLIDLLKKEEADFLVQEGKEIPLSEEDISGYSFTKADKKCFKPASDRYVIMHSKLQTQEILLSFDEKGSCIQMRVRYDFMTNVTKDVLKRLKENIPVAKNIEVKGNVMYYDIVIEADSFTDSSVIPRLKEENYELLEDHLDK